jgi:hypothetical protein
MKDNKHIQTFEQHQESLNISDVTTRFSKEEIIKRATERAKEMSVGNAEEDKQCIYNYAQGMLEMQHLLLNEW